MAHRISALLLLAALLAGCAEQPANPSFPISQSEARQAIEAMQQNPRPLDRPLVIVGGFLDPNLGPVHMRAEISSIARNSQVITVSLATCMSFDQCRQAIVDAVDAAYPGTDPNWTSEVDVIGQSLGGLAARYAAAPSDDPGHPRQLKIARLFTISSPHTGATLAETISLIKFHRDMKPGSAFLSQVAQADSQARYQLYEYVLLHDDVVGEQYASVAGTQAWWLASPPMLSPHFAAMNDDRILADIERRLRDEPAFSISPSAPLPRAG